LLSFITIGVNSEQYVLSTIWILGVCGSYVFEHRLMRGSPGYWTVNLLVVTTVLLTLLLGDDNGRTFIDSAALMSGELTAAILAVQFWSSAPYGGERGAIAAGLSAIIFLAASWTMEKYAFVAFMAPVYIVALGLALRQVRPRAEYQYMRKLHFSAFIVALAFGTGTAFEIRGHRSEISSWFMHLITPRGRNDAVGISQIPMLGATSNLQLSPARILRVSGNLTEPHLRGITFDDYQSGKWGPTIYGREFKPIPKHELTPGEQDTTQQTTVEITRLVDDFRLLVTPLHASGVVLPRRQIEWSPEYAGPLRTGMWIAPPMTYEVQMCDEFCHQGPLCVPLKDKARARCLSIPADITAAVRELANRIAGAETDPQQRVRLIVNYLKANNAYSRTTDPGKGDPLSNFILEKKAAHCVYFASAAVMLLRCVNVPTRYVTGYYAHEMTSDRSIIVRQRDGHAWAEAWIAGTGWITVDATPDEGLPMNADSIPWWMALWEWIQDRWAVFRTWAGDLSAVEQAEIVLALSALAIALQWIRAIRQKRKSAGEKIGYAFPDAALAELAEKFERWLSANSIPCPAHRTWTEHLAAVREHPQLPKGLDLSRALAFARKFSIVRFGRPADRAAISELAQEFGKFSVNQKPREQS
jgi:hypothetical protein